ncbi:MAG: MotA/TolQ/ExbB proton channel family protein [Thermoguttaceae bacterium]|nr:MotA/TolQ/ExbB proton channel family protein [Thermoguttaceae bacterium]
MFRCLTCGSLGALLFSALLLAIYAGTVTVATTSVANVAVAADDAAAADEAAAPKKENFLVWLYQALGWKYCIAFGVISFLFIAFVFKYSFSMRRSVLMPDEIVEGFDAEIQEKHFSEAYELVSNDESFMAQVLAAGLPRLQQGRDAAQKAMEDVIASESMKLDHQLSYVGLIAAVAPSVGLLGTVDGMVASFSVIANSASTPKPSELAKGISMALITTMVGLIFSIPASIFFALMKNHINKIIFDISVKGEQFMDQLLRGGK